jgi:hypothetical protein
MSRIFLSHSSANNAEAIAIRDWMIAHGWDDVFLDLDPERGLEGRGARMYHEAEALGYFSDQMLHDALPTRPGGL